MGALGPVFIGIGSLVLSLALAFLYNEQKKLQELNHQASIDVVNWDWNGDDLEVDIVNHGNAVAERVSLTTLVYVNNGEHQKYVTRSNVLKRDDQDNPWANAIEPDGNPKTLRGKRRVGTLTPPNVNRDWMSLSFHNFISRLKDEGVEEVKYCFVIHAGEPTNSRTWALVENSMLITNPQKYTRGMGLGSVTHTAHDGTFERYFSESFLKRWREHLYIKSFFFWRKIPFFGLQPRPLDASGTSRVKRVVLRQRVRTAYRGWKSRIKQKVPLIGQSN